MSPSACIFLAHAMLSITNVHLLAFSHAFNLAPLESSALACWSTRLRPSLEREGSNWNTNLEGWVVLVNRASSRSTSFGSGATLVGLPGDAPVKMLRSDCPGGRDGPTWVVGL